MTKPCTIIRRFLFELVGMISLDRYYWEVMNLFVLPGLYFNILKTERMLQQKILDVRCTSFLRKKVNSFSMRLGSVPNAGKNMHVYITSRLQIFYIFVRSLKIQNCTKCNMKRKCIKYTSTTLYVNK